MINEFDYLNFFLILNDIYVKESISSSIEKIVEQVTNDNGTPIIYSFVTKGNKFVNEYPKINDPGCKAFIRTNNCKFKDLDEKINNKVINFRKVIPINDKIYNQDVENCLNLFFQDLDHITSEYGIANFEYSVMVRFRNIISKINDIMSKEFLFTEKQKKTIKKSADDAAEFYEKKLRSYFQDFDGNLESFKNLNDKSYYEELLKVYDSKEKENNHGCNRNNYINKHIELSFENFQEIIFRVPRDIEKSAFNKIYENLDNEIKEKVIERLRYEGLITTDDICLLNINIGQFLIGYALLNALPVTAIGVTLGLRALGWIASEGVGMIIGCSVIPVIGWSAGAVMLVVSFSDCLGMWFRENTREDITKCLLKWLKDNKANIIRDSIEKFNKSKEKIIKALFECKVFEGLPKKLLDECEKFRPNQKAFPPSNYKQELKSILTNRKLKKIFTKIFDYQDTQELNK